MRVHWRRSLATVAVLAMVTGACGGGASSPAAASPAGAAPAPAAPAPAGAPAATPNPIAALKAKVQGKSIVLGVGSPPNLAEVTSRKTANILKETFDVNVEYKAVAADVEAAAVLSGSINAGEVSFARLAGLKEGGGDVLVFGTNDYRLDYVLVAKTPIKTMQELKGRTYADGGATGSSVFFNDYCFGKAGMKVEDTRVSHLSSTSAVANAIATPQFEAAMIHADTLAVLNAKFPGQYNALCYTYEGVKQTNDVWFSTSAWIKANPDMTTAILVAGMMAARWTYDKKAEWVALAKQYVANLPEGVAETTYDLFAGQIVLWSVNGALDLNACKSEMTDLVKLGRIKAPLDCASIMTLDFQTKAREILGTIPEPTPKKP